MPTNIRIYLSDSYGAMLPRIAIRLRTAEHRAVSDYVEREMLRGRDFDNALNKALDYGGKAATAYQVGKAAYAAGRLILPLIL